VPTKQRIRCHQSPDLELPFSSDRFGLDREPATSSIGESQAFSAQLLSQRSVTRKLRFLLLEILDYVMLMPIHPASEDQHQKLESQSVPLPEFR
jgi:hypothetical protein